MVLTHRSLRVTDQLLPTAHQLITLEGGEGVGKTTVIHHLQAVLRGLQVREVIVTREPGGTSLGDALREILLTQQRDHPVTDAAELLMMFAARAQHLDQVILPALKRHAFVICDRFTDSTYAYQGAANPSSIEAIAQLESRFVGIRPGLTLLLDAPVATCRQRLSARGLPQDRIESRSDAFFEAVRANYLARAHAEPERIKVIPADRQPVLVQWQVQAALLEYLAHINEKPLLD